MKFSNGVLFWDLSFIRAIQDWELKSPSNFMDSIYGIPLRAWGRIKFAACLLRKGVLRLVCITGFWLEVVINPSHGSLSGSLRFLLELLFFFFFLIVALREMLTIDILWKQKIWIWDWCFMWKINGESVDHLLIHCPIATKLWSMVFTLCGIHLVMLKTAVDLLACWQGKFRWSEWCYMDGHSTLLDVVHLARKK